MRTLSVTIFLLLCALALPALADARNAAAQICEKPSLTGMLGWYVPACANSYPGRGQILRNILDYDDVSAIDANPQSSVDFVLGGSTAAAANDPALVGLAGHSGTYLFTDGGDFLKYGGQTGGDTSIVDGWAGDLHKTTGGPDFTIGGISCIATSTATQTLVSTKATNSGSAGIVGYINTNNTLALTQNDNVTTGVTATSTGTVTDGTCFPWGFAHQAGDTNSTIWAGSLTGEVKAHTFQTYTGAATTPLTIGTSFDNTITTPNLMFESGGKYGGIFFASAFYGDVAFASAITLMEQQSGIDVTP